MENKDLMAFALSQYERSLQEKERFQQQTTFVVTAVSVLAVALKVTHIDLSEHHAGFRFAQDILFCFAVGFLLGAAFLAALFAWPRDKNVLLETSTYMDLLAGLDKRAEEEEDLDNLGKARLANEWLHEYIAEDAAEASKKNEETNQKQLEKLTWALRCLSASTLLIVLKVVVVAFAALESL